MIEKIIQELKETQKEWTKEDFLLGELMEDVIEIVQEVAKEYGYTRTLNRCDSCIHYIADKVPPICYFCSKGMEDNYKAREGE